MHTDAERFTLLSSFLTDNKRTLFERIAQDRTKHVTAVLEDIYQPHNASAVVRTCDLLGVQDLHIIENRNAYKVNPDVTLGSSKWVDLHRYRDRAANNTAQCIDALKKQGYRIVTTSPRADSVTPGSIPLDTPMAFCFGTELTGLSDELMAQADVHLRIPMHGFTESYNISVAAAIILYTVIQRLHDSTIDWRMTTEQRDALKLAWARRTVQSAEQIEARAMHEAHANDHKVDDGDPC